MSTPVPGSAAAPDSVPTAIGFRSTSEDQVSLDDLRSRIAQPEKAPERIGAYRIVGVLGEGGMGVVYQAVQLSLDRMVALKVVRGELARKEAFVGRFLREAKVAARIDHPNVVTIYDTGEADGHLYMALQYVLGGDLATRIKSNGRLGEDEALRIIAGCAKGLIAIHGAGLVHRDIKPSNIFLTTEGTPKIGDLGLARNIIDDEKLTFTGHLVGTPSYMAPEQAKGAPDIDHRADIYSLGTSFYHLLTGRPPFHGSSPFLIGHQVIAEVPQDPRELNRTMSPAVAAIIHHAMHKERAYRYQSAEELLVDVELVRSGKMPRFARVTVMDEERRATRLGSLALEPLTPASSDQRSFIPVAVGAGMIMGIAVALAVGLGLAQRSAEPPPALPSASFPRPSASTPLTTFPPSRELPPMIQEDVPGVEFLAANEPADRPLPAQPSRTVRPAGPTTAGARRSADREPTGGSQADGNQSGRAETLGGQAGGAPAAQSSRRRGRAATTRHPDRAGDPHHGGRQSGAARGARGGRARAAARWAGTDHRGDGDAARGAQPPGADRGAADARRATATGGDRAAYRHTRPGPRGSGVDRTTTRCGVGGQPRGGDGRATPAEREHRAGVGLGGRCRSLRLVGRSHHRHGEPAFPPLPGGRDSARQSGERARSRSRRDPASRDHRPAVLAGRHRMHPAHLAHGDGRQSQQHPR